MEIFNIGPLELFFIVLIAIIVLGPEESIKSLKQVGRGIYRLTHSSFWSSVMDTSKEIRELPRTIVKEAGLEEKIQEIKITAQEIQNNVHEAVNELSQDGGKTSDPEWDPVEAVRENNSKNPVGNHPTKTIQEKDKE